MPSSYGLRYCFGICVSVRTHNISTPLQNSTVWPDCNYMDWCDCNRRDWREHSIGPFVHTTVYFEVDPTILDRVKKVVFVNEVSRNVREIDANIFRTV